MLHLHLTNGSTHETDPASADHYQISTFDQTDIPIPVPQTDNQRQEPVPAAQMPTWELRDQARKVKKYVAPWYLIEFHRRFALPTSCLVLALVGIPLGLSSKKGGKSAGFRSHHSAGVCLLLGHPDRSLAGPPGQSTACVGRMAGQHCFLSVRRVSAVAGGAPALRDWLRFAPSWNPLKIQAGARGKEPAPLQPARGRLPAGRQPAPRVQRQLSP